MTYACECCGPWLAVQSHFLRDEPGLGGANAAEVLDFIAGWQPPPGAMEEDDD
ncbi:MAG TPA: hypothetical protein VM262_07250 [Acidimicrobiales bacterium]|nr:hypothetical protein [Acidimicrobiales bacterium]